MSHKPELCHVAIIIARQAGKVFSFPCLWGRGRLGIGVGLGFSTACHRRLVGNGHEKTHDFVTEKFITQQKFIHSIIHTYNNTHCTGEETEAEGLYSHEEPEISLV